MEKERVTVFGETTFRNQCQKFGIKTDDRRRHMYLIGKTGMGKSTILENMIIDDIQAGHGVAVVDPHGDLAEKVIEYVPDNRIDDVVYFNPADTEFPIAFNVVEEVGENVRHLVASGLIGVFQKLWADSWGPRLEYILRNSILAVLDHPGATLLSITRMLSDKEFRADVVENVKDPVVKAFWVKEFAGYNDRFASEAVSPIQNKVGQFLSSSLIRNIIGQVNSTIDMRKIMDERKILILNLSKGRIGEDNSTLLGAMIITKIQLAAMSRVDIDEKKRKDFYLYVDEFQNFTSDSFANILSEARKYRLNLILAHQYIEQLTETVRNAVFGNVGTLIIFRVGAADAEVLAPELAPTFTDEDILNLPKYEIYLKLMIDGVASEPFSARGLLPKLESEKTGNTQKVIDACRKKYTRSKAEVEEKIIAWHENIGAPSLAKQKKKEELYKFKTKCSRCGAETKTPFEPDGVRPVYCKDCLSVLREEKAHVLEKRKEEKKDELADLSKKQPLHAQTNIKVQKSFQSHTSQTRISNGVSQIVKSSTSKNIQTPKVVTNQRQKHKPKDHEPKEHEVLVFKGKMNPIADSDSKFENHNIIQKESSLAEPAKDVLTVSLNDLATMQPVDFRGNRKKQNNTEQKPKLQAQNIIAKVINSSTENKQNLPTPKFESTRRNSVPKVKDISIKSAGKEVELEEDSEVDFS